MPAAVLLSVQGVNQRTRHLATGSSASSHQLKKRPLDPLEVANLGAHVGELPLGQPVRRRAMRPVVQSEQFSDLGQTEAEPLRRFHETNAGDVVDVVVANTAERARRLAQEALALIEADGFYSDTGLLREHPDCQGAIGRV